MSKSFLLRKKVVIVVPWKIINPESIEIKFISSKLIADNLKQWLLKSVTLTDMDDNKYVPNV